MNNIKSVFTIKDLENLSGIKAHTIRIWEKRYKLLSPKRTDTNIRYYDIESLQKLLNITLLYRNGIKISKISALTDEQIKAQCRSIVSEKSVKTLFINDLKLAMLNFDSRLFESSYQKLLGVIDFSQIYNSYFLPFLEEIGLFWQTDTVNPVHEHFISSLIKQKILVQTENIQRELPKIKDTHFILFLPENEIHEIGLLYANYEIIKKGFESIYLGPSVPINYLKTFLGQHEKIIFVTYFTVAPETNVIPEYLNEIHEKIISKCDSELWVLGRKVDEIEQGSLPNTIKILKLNKMLELIEQRSQQFI